MWISMVMNAKNDDVRIPFPPNRRGGRYNCGIFSTLHVLGNFGANLSRPVQLAHFALLHPSTSTPHCIRTTAEESKNALLASVLHPVMTGQNVSAAGIWHHNLKVQPRVANLASRTWKKGLLFFSTPKCLFSRPRDWPSCFRPQHVFFSTSSFSPAMRPRKRAQSFFQPLCIILSSLFLGPETSCSEPRIFFGTPKHLFLDLRCCFFLTSAKKTHTRRDEKQFANQELGKLGNKSQVRENKGAKPHATDNKNQKTFFTHNKKKAIRKRFRG